MADYPGDDVIDVLEYDAYWSSVSQSEANWISLVAEDMRMIANQANSTGNNAVQVTNKGTINFTGNNITGIFADNGMVTNETTGTIKMTDTGNVGMLGAANSITENRGIIEIDSQSVGIYTVKENISIGKNSTLSTGDNSVNILLSGDSQTLNSETDKIVIGNNLFGYVATGQNNTITAGKLDNYGDIDFGTGVGNVGIYSYSKNASSIENFGTITVSQSAAGNIGMGIAAGYADSLGYVKNSGTIKVTTPDSVGMYATGNGSIAENAGTIELSGVSRNIGIYVDNKATALNTGTITTVGSGNSGQIGIAVINGTLDNRGKINIDASNGYGLVLSNTLIKNYGIMNITTGSGAIPILEEKSSISGTSARTNLEKAMGTDGTDKIKINTVDGTITLNEIPQEIQFVDTINSKASSNVANPVSSVGIYVDTSGITQTNPVNNLRSLGLKSADLIIGTEATQNTDKKYIKLGQNITAPFNRMIYNSGINEWNVYSESLTWMAGMIQTSNGIGDVFLAKIPHTIFAGNKKETKIHTTF